MPRRLAHFSDPRLDAQVEELIKHSNATRNAADKHAARRDNPHNVQAQQVLYSSGVSGFTPATVKAALDALAGVRIVESGSNENGYYVKWSNGLGLCWVKTTKQLETASNQRYPMPISFDSPYPVTGGFSISSGYIMNSNASIWVSRRTVLDSLYVAAFGSNGSAEGYAGNHWDLRNNEALGSAYDLPVTLWAIGRWY